MKNILLAIISGLLLALGWPTYGFPGLLFLGFVPLLLVEYRVRTLRFHKSIVFGFAFLSFFIWNMTATWWIYNSTPFGMWFAEIANTALMALVFLCYHIVARRSTFKISMLFLVCLWIGFEYFHLHWEFSWPWLNLGNGFANHTSWIQWYEYTGTFGGTLWIWIVNCSIFKGVLSFLKHKDKTILYKTALRNGLYIGIPILISILILNTYTVPKDAKSVSILLIQPNIDPYTDKYNTTNKQIGAYLNAMVTPKLTEDIDFVIAPETFFAENTHIRRFPFSSAKKQAQRITTSAPKAHFLGGISIYDRFRDSSKVHAQTNIIKPNDFYDDYNSAFFIRPDKTTELYHKTKLVVGVEHFPYKSVLHPIMGDAMIDLGGTVAQKTTQQEREVFFTKDSIGVAPVICYESIYGEFISEYVRNKANFIAIITNDAWWGNTQGHQQHLAYARLRAIETRRSVVRSANTGISAIIDQTGKIKTSLGYNEQGIVEGSIVTNTKMTFYVKIGNYIARIAAFLAPFLFLYAMTRRRNS